MVSVYRMQSNVCLSGTSVLTENRLNAAQMSPINIRCEGLSDDLGEVHSGCHPVTKYIPFHFIAEKSGSTRRFLSTGVI